MSVSDSPPSSMLALHQQACGSLGADACGQAMDAALFAQNMAFPRTPDGQMMGYLPYPSCLSSSGADRPAPQQQDFSQFLLPPPASSLRLPGQKRGPSKDSVEYRLRRERNNIAVRKSRDKARRRVQLTQQRALQLQDENQRLQLHIQRLSHEVEALRHYLSQRHPQARDAETEHGC